MSININVGEVKYAPSRDVVYLWPMVLTSVADRLEDRSDRFLHAWLDEQGVTTDDLGAAMGAYCKFMEHAHCEPDKNVVDMIRDSGWWECRWEARHAVMFYAGVMMTGIFFRGTRDVTLAGAAAIPSVQYLLRHAARFERRMAWPAWRRWLSVQWSRFRQLLASDGSLDKDVRSCEPKA